MSTEVRSQRFDVFVPENGWIKQELNRGQSLNHSPAIAQGALHPWPWLAHVMSHVTLQIGAGRKRFGTDIANEVLLFGVRQFVFDHHELQSKSAKDEIYFEFSEISGTFANLRFATFVANEPLLII